MKKPYFIRYILSIYNFIRIILLIKKIIRIQKKPIFKELEKEIDKNNEKNILNVLLKSLPRSYIKNDKYEYRYDLENIQPGDYAFETWQYNVGGFEYGIGSLVIFVNEKIVKVESDGGLSKKERLMIYQRNKNYLSTKNHPYAILKSFIRPGNLYARLIKTN